MSDFLNSKNTQVLSKYNHRYNLFRYEDFEAKNKILMQFLWIRDKKNLNNNQFIPICFSIALIKTTK